MQKQKIIYVCLGIPFSGKTTWRRKFVSEHPDTIVICPDDIRLEILGNISDQSKNNMIWGIAINRFEKAVTTNNNIIIDGTNLSSSTRSTIYKKRNMHKIVYVIFNITYDEAIRRKELDINLINTGVRANPPDEFIKDSCIRFENLINNIAKDMKPYDIIYI